MNLGEILREAARFLSNSGMPDEITDARVLLCHTLHLSCADLYLYLHEQCSINERRHYWSLVARRARHEPVAYITGHREFYGLDFYVDNRVLIPRPETEQLADAAIALAHRYPLSQPISIADIGTGSGAIASSIATRLPRARLYAVDISASALEVASINLRLHGLSDRITLLQGNLLEPLPQNVDVIVANLPYVRTVDVDSDRDLAFEPRLALDGGDDGLDHIRLFLRQAQTTHRATALILEIGHGQSEEVKRIAAGIFPDSAIQIQRDPTGTPRTVAITIPCLSPVPQ